jgi:hypothetical protein
MARTPSGRPDRTAYTSPAGVYLVRRIGSSCAPPGKKRGHRREVLSACARGIDGDDRRQPGHARAHRQYWSLINVPVPVPVLGPDGRVALLPHRVEEATEFIRAREVALSLRDAMPPTPQPSSARTDVAVQAASGDPRQRSVATEVL